MTKATDKIAAILADTRTDESARVSDPYEDTNPAHLQARHAAKIEETYREVLKMNRRCGIVTIDERNGGLRVDVVDIIEDTIPECGFDIVSPFRVRFILATGDLAPVDVEAMRAELHAVHSELGDASQTVFDLLESLAGREGTIAKLTAKVSDLESRITELKSKLDRAKTQAGPML